MHRSTVDLVPGDRVITTHPEGDDFGIPLVRPTMRTIRKPGVPRDVRSVIRQNGGCVVRFADGTKTPPLHGRTAWLMP